MKTDSSTSVVAITGPVISVIDSIAASLGDMPSSSMCRVVFSTTTMASSTTIPITSTSPKSVNWLMEYPIIDITAKVPIKDTGIVAAGINVARTFCRKT